MSNILIILGHPDKKSFNGAIAAAYYQAAKKAGHSAEQINLGDLKFDPVLRHGYKKIQKLEPDLVNAQQKIKWADFLVFVFPTWWFNYPAILKGFIDRAILPGFAFKYKEKSFLPLPERYLKGKKSILITTVDGSPWFYRFLGHPGLKSLKTGVLFFCGVKTSKQIVLGPVKNSSPAKRKKWLGKIAKMAQKIN